MAKDIENALFLELAQALSVKSEQVAAAVRLLDDGATVPFIARYRKEITQGLNDTQLRFITNRLEYLRELNERRSYIITSIKEQDKLTPVLENAILTATTKARLEDLFLPYRTKRRTKATMAKEAGLEPLALTLWHHPETDPLQAASAYINSQNDSLSTENKIIEGAKQILLERFAEDADLLDHLRSYFWKNACLKSKKIEKKNTTKNTKKNNPKNHSDIHKFQDYFDYSEALNKIPSHRALALFRGRREEMLHLSLYLPVAEDYPLMYMEKYFSFENKNRPADHWLQSILLESWQTRVLPKIEVELFARLRELADEEAIYVFSQNLRDLLLTAPAGAKVTMGLDPGIRTGVKVAVVDSTGKLLDYATIFPFAPNNDWEGSLVTLAKFVAKYHVSLVSIGNGTGSRETERLVGELIQRYPDLSLTKVMVSEAGASVYSASELAAEEFPELDVTIRGAVSIARRLQDPLAELVKIDPKAIGVGQYQHDVNPSRLAHSLAGVVEDCVNAVGVDVNMASVPLLMHISGLNMGSAKQLVAYREKYGAFKTREDFRKVSQFGDKTFQQAAGFLRIMQGDNVLDASGIHPESYSLVEKIACDQGVKVQDFVCNTTLLKQINMQAYVTNHVGIETIQDVCRELEKPGRDPRPTFKTACFKEGIEEIGHLKLDMILEGVVSNVTNFGAFVDIGVHQDGLVHISALTNRFVKDPRMVVKAGDVVTVKVIEIDVARKRIGLSMNFDVPQAEQRANALISEESAGNAKIIKSKNNKNIKNIKNNKNKDDLRPDVRPVGAVFNTAMADALSKLKRG